MENAAPHDGHCCVCDSLQDSLSLRSAGKALVARAQPFLTVAVVPMQSVAARWPSPSPTLAGKDRSKNVRYSTSLMIFSAGALIQKRGSELGGCSQTLRVICAGSLKQLDRERKD
jgi:hypothetical protein